MERVEVTELICELEKMFNRYKQNYSYVLALIMSADQFWVYDEDIICQVENYLTVAFLNEKSIKECKMVTFNNYLSYKELRDKFHNDELRSLFTDIDWKEFSAIVKYVEDNIEKVEINYERCSQELLREHGIALK